VTADTSTGLMGLALQRASISVKLAHFAGVGRSGYFSRVNTAASVLSCWRSFFMYYEFINQTYVDCGLMILF
jgi:hypothetical protein